MRRCSEGPRAHLRGERQASRQEPGSGVADLAPLGLPWQQMQNDNKDAHPTPMPGAPKTLQEKCLVKLDSLESEVCLSFVLENTSLIEWWKFLVFVAAMIFRFFGKERNSEDSGSIFSFEWPGTPAERKAGRRGESKNARGPPGVRRRAACQGCTFQGHPLSPTRHGDLLHPRAIPRRLVPTSVLFSRGRPRHRRRRFRLSASSARQVSRWKARRRAP